MRLVVTFLAVAILAPVAAAADKQDKPITPAEAAKMVDKKVTVEMEVKSVGKSTDKFFLNSEEDFKNAKNFTLYIDADAAKKFKEAKIDDIQEHFKGKTIRVTGTVKLYREKPEIVVDDPKQIVIVEKKKG